MSERVALITGAGSGIGRATAVRLGSAGSAVVCLDLDPDSSEATAQQIRSAGGTALGLRADVTEGDAVSAAVAEAAGWRERLDVVVNAAGIAFRESFTETDLEHLDQMWSVNVRGTYAVCRASTSQLARRGGAIVNVASVAALRGSFGLAAYSATKGAVVSLSAALAVELSPLHIRVNCVSPGAVDTPLLGRLAAPANAPADQVDRSRSLSGRSATPDEVADAIAFLASAGSSHLTGVNLPIDGGSRA